MFIAAITLTRGFTMHEHLDQVGLIHMGGRVYDPELGRFLSPDPFVQFAVSTQGFNRYAYVSNNPLSYTDPSGYFLKKLMKAAGIGMNFIPGWTLAGNAFIHGFVSGFLASGGDARAGMMGMLSAGIAGEIGGIKDLNHFKRALAHGVTQGAISAAGGGRFGDGALGAFSGSLLSFIPEAVAGPYGTGGEGAKIGRMVAAAAVGGTVSKIGGGKFANGAWSAAFVSRFNHESIARRQPTIEISIGYTDTPVGLGTNHALVIATDPNTGEQYATRAGPALNRRGGCCVIEAESGVYDHTFRDNPADVHTVQHVGSVDISLEVFAARAAEFAAVTNHNSVPYTGFGTNSNSYAFSFVESLGLGRPTPAVWAPGWRSGNPSRELTYP